MRETLEYEEEEIREIALGNCVVHHGMTHSAH
jgi:hypothetical protein